MDQVQARRIARGWKMSDVTIDLSPARFSFELPAGDTVRLPFTFFSDLALTTPADLSGMTFVAQRTDRAGVTVDGTVEFVPTSTLVVRFGELPTGLFRYVVRGVTTATGERQSLVAGQLEVTEENMGCGCGY